MVCRQGWTGSDLVGGKFIEGGPVVAEGGYGVQGQSPWWELGGEAPEKF